MLFIKTKCLKKIQYTAILFELTNIILIVTNKLGMTLCKKYQKGNVLLLIIF